MAANRVGSATALVAGNRATPPLIRTASIRPPDQPVPRTSTSKRGITTSLKPPECNEVPAQPPLGSRGQDGRQHTPVLDGPDAPTTSQLRPALTAHPTRPEVAHISTNLAPRSRQQAGRPDRPDRI